MAGSYQLHVNQDKSKSIIQNLILRLTKVENLFLKNDRGYDNKMTMLVHLKNLSEDLNEISKLLMNSGQETTGGALVKAVLESILQKLSIILEYKSEPETDDDDQEAKLLCSSAQFEAEFDKLKGIVSNLIQYFIKLQASRLLSSPGDSVFKVSLTITQINTTTIPAVLTRLELANTYSLSQKPSDKYQSMGKQVKKLTSYLGYITSFLTKLEEHSNNLGPKLGNFVEAILRLSDLDNLGTGCKDGAKQLQAKLCILRKVVVKLKRQISPELQPRDSDEHWYAQVGREFVLEMLPVIHLDEKFPNSSAFCRFRQVYESLELRTKMCLLCFAVILENEVVKERFMTH